MKNTSSILWVVGGLALLPMSAATALECPVLHSEGPTSTIAESVQDVAEDGHRLMNYAYNDSIGEIAFRLRDKYPDATNAEIQNYLLTAFCSSLVQSGYDAERQASVYRAFINSVVQQVWGTDGKLATQDTPYPAAPAP